MLEAYYIKILSYIINVIGKRLPNILSSQLSKVPFKYRFGKEFQKFERIVSESKAWSNIELEKYIIHHFNEIFQHAKKNNFYKQKYTKAGVLDKEIKCIEDIKDIPILTRDEVRSNIGEFKGAFLEKTGGSSGNPLFLYLDKNIWAREWAHYHDIWKDVGYEYTNSKFVLKRENNKDEFLRFDFEHNEFVINPYMLSKENIVVFINIMKKNKVKYLHGFPSSIYDFLFYLDTNVDDFQRDIIKSIIECCLFSSEMPLQNVTNYVRDVWGFNYIACYGHTEACVLASSGVNNLLYKAIQTYGYVEDNNGLLLGTSYHNYDMPLIRYKTDELIKAVDNENGILKSFYIKEGRILDFFLDKKGLKIYYLDLFYETKGEIFDYIHHLQFFQEKQGKVKLFLTRKSTENFNVNSLLNLKQYDLIFEIYFIDNPIRTQRGKVPFRLTKNLVDNFL